MFLDFKAKQVKGSYHLTWLTVKHEKKNIYIYKEIVEKACQSALNNDIYAFCVCLCWSVMGLMFQEKMKLEYQL